MARFAQRERERRERMGHAGDMMALINGRRDELGAALDRRIRPSIHLPDASKGHVGEPARRQAPPVPTATQGMNFDVPGNETAPGPGISPDGSTIVLYDGGMQKTLTSVAG